MITSRPNSKLTFSLKAVGFATICLLVLTTPAISRSLRELPTASSGLRLAPNGPLMTAIHVNDHKADAKAVVDKLVSGDFEGIRKNFNAQMKANLSAEKMKAGWDAIVNQLGQYKSQGPPHSGNGGGYEIVVVRCQMEKGEMDVEVDYDSDGLIGGLWLRPLS